MPRNAEGQAIFMGKCHSCGLPGHSAGRCPNLGGPMAHYSNCGKCGTYGHDAKLCPTQVNAVEPENNGAQMGKDTSDAHRMDVGGGSFYIDCIETSNKYSELAEEAEDSSWTNWRGYYRSTPAPPSHILTYRLSPIRFSSYAQQLNNREIQLNRLFRLIQPLKTNACHRLHPNGLGHAGKRARPMRNTAMRNVLDLNQAPTRDLEMISTCDAPSHL